MRQQLTAEERKDLRCGMSLCVPTSCSADEVRHLVLLFFVCTFGRCGVPGIPGFLQVQEVNVTLADLPTGSCVTPQGPLTAAAPVAVAAATPSPPAVAVGAATDEAAAVSGGAAESPPPHVKDVATQAIQCVYDARHSGMEDIPDYLGLPWFPVDACSLTDLEIRQEVIPLIKQCRALDGRTVLLIVDLQRFLGRLRDEVDAEKYTGMVREAAVQLLSGDVNSVFAQDFINGIGVCLPASCMPLAARPAFGFVAADILARSAGLAESLWPALPPLQPGSETVAHGWALAVRTGHVPRSCLPKEESIINAVLQEGWEDDGRYGSEADESSWFSGLQDYDLLADERQTELVKDLKRAGFNMPTWLACNGPPVNQEWQDFAHDIRAEFLAQGGPGVEHTVDSAMWARADSLIEGSAHLAGSWATWVSEWSNRTCRLEYVHFDEMTLRMSTDFTIAQFMLSPGDWRWQQLEEFEENAAFCPMGFVVALYARAVGLRFAGFSEEAVADLAMARMLTGNCSELDFLEPEIWGMRTLDIEMLLWRLTFPREESGLPEDTQLVAPIEIHGTDIVVKQTWPLEAVWPEPVQTWRTLAYLALQMNTLVRMWLREAAAGHESFVPRLMMLAYPAYLCLFMIPMLLRIWGEDLNLALFVIGTLRTGGQLHEKCPSCMLDYEQKYLRQSPHLEEMPKFHSGSNWHFDFGGAKNFTYGGNFLALLRLFLQDDAHARAAHVHICMSPMWLCGALMKVGTRPVLTLDLPDASLGRFTMQTHPQELLRKYQWQLYTKLFSEDLARGPPLGGLFVREDLQRGGFPADKGDGNNRWPFVHMPSLYVSARYQGCQDGQRVLIMRGGSLMRFSTTFRGRLFFATLLQFETLASPWHFKMMHESDERLSYEELAAHRACMWVPLNMASKVTLKDLQTMEIPLFVPGRMLQASISARQTGMNCRNLAHDAPAWTYIMCREVKISHWLPLSPLFRNPLHVHFESVAEVVHVLSRHSCADLDGISRRMRAWNAAAVASDEAFWRDAVLGLYTWSAERAGFPLPPVPAPAPAPGTIPARPARELKYRHHEVLVHSTPWWAAVDTEAVNLTANCDALTSFCHYGIASGGDFGREGCCMHSPLQKRPLRGEAPRLGDGCLGDVSACSEALLRFGLTLFDDVDRLTVDGAV